MPLTENVPEFVKSYINKNAPDACISACCCFWARSIVNLEAGPTLDSYKQNPSTTTFEATGFAVYKD